MADAATPSARNPDLHVVPLSGRLDMAAAEAATDVIMDAVGSSPGGAILDLTAVDFISSAGLRLLILARRTAESEGKKLGIIGAQPAVYKIFKVSGLDSVFAFFKTEPEAVEGLGS